jgi:hypothetical protein
MAPRSKRSTGLRIDRGQNASLRSRLFHHCADRRGIRFWRHRGWRSGYREGAKVLFFVFLILAAVSLIANMARRS